MGLFDVAMLDGFKNRPKIQRGAFVEYGLAVPPAFVVFQFNPIQLSRNRSLNFTAPNARATRAIQRPDEENQAGTNTPARQPITTTVGNPLREFHQREFENKDNLLAIRDQQMVTIQEESISFEIRLDATDKLNDGDPITEQFGITPQLSTLELMTVPKGESLIGKALGIVGSSSGHSYTRRDNPPMILFIWGRKRVLPVNIRSLNITETEFSTDLNPIRATASVSLTVVEGKNAPYLYSKAMKEAMSGVNLANITEIADVIIPG